MVSYQLINFRQLINYFFGFVGILGVNAILIVGVRYERIVQLSVPQLKQTGWRMGINFEAKGNNII